jgi:hypothetical protein
MVSECATFERVDSLLSYNPETGIFHWRVSRGRLAKAGSIAGSPHKNGQIQICIDRKLYKAHRVAHLLMTGSWPDGNPEHESRIGSDNRWINICDLATRRENGGNRNLNRNSTSGLKGVTWSKQKRKWVSQIEVLDRRLHLGYFTDPRLAGITYDAAAKLVFGLRFSCLNFPPEESDRIVLSDRILSYINGGMWILMAARMKERGDD